MRKLTRWLDRRANFDIAIQHIAGSNLKVTDYLSTNPVEGATLENNHDEEYVITILSEQASLNLKYGQLYADQSNDSKLVTERDTGTSERIIQQQNNPSQSNRTFQNKNSVNKRNRNGKIHPGSPKLARQNQVAN